MKVVTLGMGYIGLPTSALIANHNISVTGIDINQHVVDTINKGKIHIVEPDLDEVVKNAVNSGHLKASTSPVIGDVYLIVVPTPFKNDHNPDTSYIEDATRSIIPLLKKGDLYIIESTSPVGTTERMTEIIFSERPELEGSLYISYCPERVLPGNVMHELVHNDRVVGGINEPSTKVAIEFYSRFVKGKIFGTNSRTAEMCKLVENSSRDVQIAFANELDLICKEAEVDVWELIDLANKHPRVNILQPGCGVGGHCIAVDPYFLVSEFPKQTKLIKTARELNNYKPEWCVDKIKEEISKYEKENNKESVISICGLAFKPNIDDLRESPAVIVAEKVSEIYSQKEINYVEPNVTSHKKFKIVDLEKAINNSDILIILVGHKEFKGLENSGKKIISFVNLE
ncbi:MAG: UDP-N-acetyl-D-mannosamine dehydrogenase [Verrucomicrobiales bacterium]